jgi:pimeloyl-ACP methyl ester carboxylesterase
MKINLRARLAATLLFVAVAGASSSYGQSAPSHDPVRREVRADDGHGLIVWEKRPSGNVRGEIVLLHGRTWSALPNFDLHVRGQQVSLMDALAARGYAVYALDQRGYGATARDGTGWLTPLRAAADAEEVTDWVAAHAPSSRRPALMGYSRGSATAMLAAQRHPEKLSALIMYGPYYDTQKRPETPREPSAPPRVRTTAEAAGEDFLTPQSTPAGMKQAYVAAALKYDPIRVDWRHEEQFDALDPAVVHTPTLVIHGEKDPYAAAAGVPWLFSKLGTADRWWVVLANGDHVAHLERQPAFVSAVVSFLERGSAQK